MGSPSPRIVAALLALLTTLAFVPGLGGGFVFDDTALIVDDDYLHDPAQLPRLLTHAFWDVSQGMPQNATYATVWRPVVKLAYATEWSLFGDAPLGYHVINLLLHVGCALLGFVWIRQRLGASLGATYAAGLSVLLVAVHPARVESVSWISGCPDLFMTFFVLAGAVLWQRRARPRLFAAACLCFALAVMSKEPAVLVPLLLLLDRALIEHAASGQRNPADRRRLAVVAAVCLGAFALRFAFLSPSAPASSMSAEMPARVLTSLGHFVLSTFVPLTPSMHPGLRHHTETGEPLWAPEALAAGALFVLLAAILIVAARRRPKLRPYVADLAWFVVPLLPVLNVFSIGSVNLISERFLYLPHFGLACLLARALSAHLAPDAPARPKSIAVGLALVAAAGLSFVSVGYEAHFESDETLFAYEASVTPDNVVVLGELARLAEAAGRREEAYAKYAHAHGVAVAVHDLDRRLDFALAAARLRATDLPHENQDEIRDIAELYAALADGRLALLSAPGLEVRLALPSELRQQTWDDVRYFSLPFAHVAMRIGDFERANAILDRIERQSPNDARALSLRAMVLARSGDLEGAARLVESGTVDGAFAERIRRAARLATAPTTDALETTLRDAQVHGELADYVGARVILTGAITAFPDRPEPAVMLARIHAADRRFDLATGVLEAAQVRNPENATGWAQALEEVARLAAADPDS